MHKNIFIPAIVGLALCSCVSQFEAMSKGTERGDQYVYHYGQIGGKGTGQSSMGTSVGFDGEKSFADAVQAYAAGKISLNTLKGRVSDNARLMHKEGQITERTLAGFEKDIALAEGTPAIIAAQKALPK